MNNWTSVRPNKEGTFLIRTKGDTNPSGVSVEHFRYFECITTKDTLLFDDYGKGISIIYYSEACEYLEITEDFINQFNSE